MQRQAVRILAILFAGLAVLFAVETFWDLHVSGLSWGELKSTPVGTRALASTVSRAFNNLLAMVLSFVAIAIPITANMYTPKLVEIFFRDRVNVLSMICFAGMGAHAIWSQWMMFDQWVPQAHVAVLIASGVVGFAVVIPYYLYVLDFLNPSTIIRRVRERVTDVYDCIPRTAPFTETRAQLENRILQLGNVVLRAMDRADRDVAIEAIQALEESVAAYSRVKRGLNPDWFRVEPQLFPGLSAEALSLLHRDRTWVEHKTLSQLYLGYGAALSRMPDAISAISIINRRVALHACAAGDDAALGLSIRYFNTFVRAAISKRDVHAVFDVFHEYRLLATDLLSHAPARSVEIARHFRYYAGLARISGLQFIYELAAADLATLAEAAYEAEAEGAPEILAVLLAFHTEGTSARLVKAEAALAAFFERREMDAEAELLRSRIMQASIENLQTARRDFAATTDSIFWEVTDRQINLDYLPEVLRGRILRLLDEAIEHRTADL